LFLLSSALRLSLIFYCPYRPPPNSTLFPYTTLFRSLLDRGVHPDPLYGRRRRAPVPRVRRDALGRDPRLARGFADADADDVRARSEEHTSELQSLRHLVCRLLLEKKNYTFSTLKSR